MTDVTQTLSAIEQGDPTAAEWRIRLCRQPLTPTGFRHFEYETGE